MSSLLSKTQLDSMRRTLYGSGVKVVFYKVTPETGGSVIATLTSGFHMVREQRTGGRDGQGVRMWLASGLIEPTLLRIGAEIGLTVGGLTTRYSIVELLPMQQLGAGYVLRLTPLQGATG